MFIYLREVDIIKFMCMNIQTLLPKFIIIPINNNVYI